MATTFASPAGAHPALRCPKCAGEMVSYERSGIHLEQCRECRGMFLDRGELERLVDAEGAGWAGPQVPARAPAPPPATRHDAGYRSEWHGHDEDDHRRRDNRRDGGDGRWTRDGSTARPARRRSLLSDLLESLGE